MLIVTLVGLAGFAIYKYWPTEEKAIRRTLRNLAATISFDKQESPLARVANATRVSDYFSHDVVINLAGTGAEVPSIQSREDLREAVIGARSVLRSLHVSFKDLKIGVNPAQHTAVVLCTGLADIDGKSDAFVQELKLRLAKGESGWQITSVDPVQLFRR